MRFNLSLHRILQPHLARLSSAADKNIPERTLFNRDFVERALPDVHVSEALLLSWCLFRDLDERNQALFISKGPDWDLDQFDPEIIRAREAEEAAAKQRQSRMVRSKQTTPMDDCLFEPFEADFQPLRAVAM